MIEVVDRPGELGDKARLGAVAATGVDMKYLLVYEICCGRAKKGKERCKDLASMR
ncbi:BQ5605_C016g08248 [Microbotryum silenes-dioicae]|uniref:BQ5605_C016g08248 protein n=1 Tax=Microbotryum silenes-dioicae TaxID=796604 RepID=A0A2X0LVT8_9BASI|nr:BQ5605_C016g08248 [Microbotryum silenes-dioicae]